MQTSTPPVFVLGSGITALGVIRSLGRARIPLFSLCPPNELPVRSRWYRPAPLFSNRTPQPSELADYLDSLPRQPAVLIPCSDDWAQAVSALPDSLRDRFPASIPAAQVMDTMIDKWCFAQIAEALKIPRPRTILLHSLSEMSALPDSCFESAFLKPIESQEFSTRNKVKAFQFRDKTHALEIMTRGVGSGATDFPILLQEYIPGPPTRHYLLDGFMDRDQRLRALIARRRIRMYPPVFGNSTLSETVSLHEVNGAIETLDRLLNAVRYRGIFDVEFKFDERDGQFKIIEVNARPWWHIGFVARCGVDLCRMSYLDALGLPFESIHGYPSGKRTAYLASDFRAYRLSDPGIAGFFRWMKSWMGAYDAIYSSHDPWPGMVFAWEAVGHLPAGAGHCSGRQATPKQIRSAADRPVLSVTGFDVF